MTTHKWPPPSTPKKKGTLHHLGRGPHGEVYLDHFLLKGVTDVSLNQSANGKPTVRIELILEGWGQSDLKERGQEAALETLKAILEIPPS